MKPDVVLVLTLVLGTVGLTALFWGLALFVQGYLYNQPADRLPLRALAAGLGVAIFLTGWTYLNTRASHVNKYGVLHEFNPTSQRPVDEFEAVRRLGIKDEKGQPKEVTVPFKWEPGGAGGGRFVEKETGKEFQVNTANYMTVGLLVPEPDGNKARFNAKLKDGVYAREGDNIRFEEQGGGRFIETSTSSSPRHMEVPSTTGFVAAVAINVLHYVVWFLAFWLGLRFTVGHSLGLAAAFGTAAMLMMPLLFEQNRLRPVIAVPQPQQAAPK